MKNIFYTLLLTGAALLPFAAHAESSASRTPMCPAMTQSAPEAPRIIMSTGNLDGYTIGRIQQSLADRGYYEGPVSGYWDSQSASALRSFQQASGDASNTAGSLISSVTLARLGLPMDRLAIRAANADIAHGDDPSFDRNRVLDPPKILGQITIPADQPAAYAALTGTSMPAAPSGKSCGL